ncbi:N-acetylglucosaminyl-diphospho-decaprenol L-rhamnosyltransferase [termite gut metagenome]|uniref:N-acetylglucosaminyl-diphospho-decaprenol L-rhamnosyltransferase n=1 Tax=termite gut metagenome TaxID=433724 RepID=A0A5J4S315_9ZZZZ
MDVSIIIVNYNTKLLTSKCINSIVENTQGVIYEIILVDNASTDGSQDLFRNDKRIKFIENNENLGFGKANNIGIQIIKGRNVFFLNSDTILLNNSIKYLSDYLDENMMVGACGGNLFNEKMNPTHSYRMLFPSIIWEVNFLLGNMIERILYKRNREFNYTGRPHEVAYITGADLMIKKNILDFVGCFSSAFFMYYEDTDLCYRIYQNGYKIVSLPTAKIQHLEGKSSANKISSKKILMLNKSRLMYYKLHYTKFYINIANIIYLFLIISRILFFYKRSWKYIYWKMNLNVFRVLKILNE